MEASDTTPVQDAPVKTAVQTTMDAWQHSQAMVELTVGGGPGAVLVETKFPRLSLTRRALGHVTDEVDETAYGPRNTLSAITRGLVTDVHTTNPRNPEAGRLDITNATREQTFQAVLDQLDMLEEAGLVAKALNPDTGMDECHVTEAGAAELAS